LKPERWGQIERVYTTALETEASQRSAFLDHACAGDDALRREVESLLAYVTRAQEFIESPAIEMAATMPAQELAGSAVGQKAGPYEILSLLGAGGMGEVYLAEDTRLGRKVALKLLPKGLTQDLERVRRFEQEARAVSALNHPNILTIYDIGQVDDIRYIATEFIEGQTLRQEMATGRLELRNALDVACQVASALSAAHEAGIVHRDIKPENIMLRRDGYVKVLDFGLAKLAKPRGLIHSGPIPAGVSTEVGVVLGTVNYMSPEQTRGQALDARTDIFSFGVVLYEMISGRSPFAGSTSADVIASILEKHPPALPRRGAPEALEWIISKALRKDRDERHQTAKELLSDLKSLRRRLEFEEELERSKDGDQTTVAAATDSEYVSSGAGRAERQPRNVIDSLAILPLTNTTADPAMEYFSDGITEGIINTLSRLPELRVMAWSTVSNYRNQHIDPREIGRNLRVRAVLTGRVVQLDDRLVIKTELVDASDGSHLWGENYGCRPSDVLDVEAKISREISEKLLVRLTTEERRRLAKRYTENTEAYHAYLKGRHFWNKRTDESVRQGIEYFKQAIDADPSYALAYAGLADAYVILGSFGIATLPPGEAFPKAKAAAIKALEIDDSLAEAHASLAICLASYDWDWPAAEKEFKRSIELKPDYATAHHWYGFIYLTAMGRLDEAIASEKRAHELAPLSLAISSDLGLLSYLARKYDQAIDQYHQTLEMDQSFAYSHWKLGLAYEQKGMYEQAISELHKAVGLSGRSTLAKELLGYVCAVAGKADEARAVLDELSELSKHRHVSAYRVAAIYAALNRKDQAFDWLERAYEQRDPWLIWLKLNPVLDSIRSDSRFTDLLRRIGLEGSSQAAETSPRTAILPLPKKAPSRKRSPRKTITSLAILPLANISGDPEMEYLSEGVTESIINTLSQLPKLRVVARSTVFRYKGQEVDPQQVGRELGVQAVLTGRVRQTADRLMIAIELTDVASDSQLWGEHYNRNLSDIFEVQEKIAGEITEKLRLKLNRKDKGRLKKRHTDSVDAYHAYLKGRYFWYQRTEEALRRGIEYFNKAIEHDPSYAAAYDGLSDSYALLALRGLIPAREAFLKAKAAAKRALQIDDALGEAHASLAHIRLHEWDWAGLEEQFKRAIELSPGHAIAYHWYSEYLRAMGRSDESIAIAKRAQEVDPLSPVISVTLAGACYFARLYDQAIEHLHKGLEINPDHFLLRFQLGLAYLQKEMHEEAIEEMRRAVSLSGSSTETLSGLGQAYAAAGMQEEVRKVLDDLNEQSEKRYVSPYYVAKIYAALGDKEQALGWLERGFKECNPDFIELNVEPQFDHIRSDPRFTDLLRRVGLLPSRSSAAREFAIEASHPVAQTIPAGIAILPFKPINPEQRDEYLELGIADALITKLSDIKQIVVRPTSSVRKYTGLEQDSVAAGRELAVESVLEGCIQKLADRIRVTARLVRVEDGRSLWTGKFDENFTDIFAVEDSISERVAAALALRLTGDERERLTKRYTDNTAAYNLYLKGRYHWNKRTEEAVNKAVECFNQANEIDPNYALSYAGLADCYTKLGDVGVTAMTPREAFARARQAALKALEIDSSLAEVHASLGHQEMHLLQWADAERDFKRAIELNPNYATAHQWYAYFMAFHRRFDEALEKIEVARKLDPLSLPIADSVGEFLYFTRRNDEAIEHFRKALELDPNFLASRIHLGCVYEQLAMFSDARDQFLKARQIAGESIDALAALGHSYAMSANTGGALEILAQLTELSNERYVSPYDIALIHTALGETDEAFRWLEKAYDQCVEWMIYTNVDPRLDPLRTDARFSSLLERLGFATGNVNR